MQSSFSKASASEASVLDVLEVIFIVYQIGDQETIIKVREDWGVLMGEYDIY
jgi:hypothetical protein